MLKGLILHPPASHEPSPRDAGAPARAVLQQSILDVFDEYGVQIMTPAYEGDPEQPKVVPRDQWWTAPARPAPDRAASPRGSASKPPVPRPPPRCPSSKPSPLPPRPAPAARAPRAGRLAAPTAPGDNPENSWNPGRPSRDRRRSTWPARPRPLRALRPRQPSDPLALLVVEVLDVDEAAHAVGSWVLLDGGRLYTDFVDNKPPLLYGYYALAQLLPGRGLLPVHAVTAIVTVPLVALAASATFRHDRRGVAAGLLWLAYGASFRPTTCSRPTPSSSCSCPRPGRSPSSPTRSGP